MKILLCLATLFLLACTQNPEKKSNDNKELSIITPDWSVASTLTAIGSPPVATGDLTTLPDWSLSPKLPSSTIDLGARFTPNPELMAQLSADLFIYSGFYGHLDTLNTMPSWEYKGVDKKDKTPNWDDYRLAVLELGKKIGKESEMTEYINQTAQHLTAQGLAFKQKHPHIKQVSIVQFGSATQLYNYTKATPFGVALDKMGIDIVDLGKSGEWGSYIADISELTNLPDDTCLLIVKPFNTLLQQALAKNALWQHLGYEQGERCAMVLEPAWAFGDFPSMAGFADNLLTATPYLDYPAPNPKTGGKK